MTTLDTLKARIADDIARSDVTSPIADAITDAINHYKGERFYFNESRTATFATVADQETYTSSDDADIPLYIDLDGVWVEDSTNNYKLRQYDIVEMEDLIPVSGATSGRPYAFSYFNQSFRLYPVPDQAYTVRPVGHLEVAAPATGSEADNVWMTEAFELLRCRAKAYLAVHILRDPEMLILMRGADAAVEPPGGAEGAALAQLRRGTAKRFRSGDGRIQPTDF